eukprot:CAMPEP_0185570028 /NCGR_PEP_ID=MMETSP0434-20130131/2471_1 /TAXON_ID=626734 ORGANISM="Favella taraikaensis, Strain Fe Narragansett Bay" /NCGR_SAMPLE_ID=MMETSP0434 /ASSEMBLY_ACC=CAM_ASM_000379 /LENGTH=160 /DNA_ID=CAMNT_0028185025 /DNA_START=108 /DNA_END=587 /DNA_ORIENTATION=-
MRCLSAPGRSAPLSLLPNNEVHIDARVQSEFSDLLDGGGGAVDVDDALVDAHLEAVPGVGTIAARGSARRDNELLGGNADGALHLVVELLGLGYDLGTCLLEGFHFSASEGHADSLDLLGDLLSLHLFFVSVHFQISKANFLINNKQAILHPFKTLRHQK